MSIEIENLPYSKDALAPHISAHTVEVHYEKHHKGYLAKVNAAILGTPDEKRRIDEIVMSSPEGPLLNSAAQTWNHTFYWKSMSPSGGGLPSGPLQAKIIADFGSFDAFKKEFTAAAVGHFGSGWVWLVKGKDQKLQIVQTHDGGCPLRSGLQPLLACDVWEHAYYLDRENRRPEYVEAWWNLVHWELAASLL